MKRLLIAFSILIMAIAFLSREAFAGAVVIGTVNSGRENAGGGIPSAIYPVDGAAVSIQGTNLSTTTNGTGGFVFKDVPPGNYTIIASKAGYSMAAKQIVVPDGGGLQVLLTLTTGGGVTIDTGPIKPGMIYIAFAGMPNISPAGPTQPGGMTNQPQSNEPYNMLGAISAGADPFALGGNPPPTPPQYTPGQNPYQQVTPVNVNPNTIMVIDPDDVQKINYINLNSRPSWICFSASGTKLFVADDTQRIIIYDTLQNNNAVGAISLPGVITDMTASKEGILYAAVMAGVPSVVAISTSTMSVIKLIPLPGMRSGEFGQPRAVVLSPDGRKLYVTLASTTAGEVIAIDVAAQQYLGAAKTGSMPTGMVITPDGRKILTANYTSADVSVIDTASMQNVGTIRVGVQPSRLVAHPSGAKVYVVNNGSSTVSVIDLAYSRVSATIPVGSLPIGIGITPDGSKVFVSNNGAGTVSIIETATNGVIRTTTPLPNGKPFGIAVKP
ncbi:MAG: carboxypeptidase regulatory-like domain-containing protein [Firmicutes bacterium]|nr:carboxypeptidase regulatory-like domain-containing protein [Bacillota bacterium]